MFCKIFFHLPLLKWRNSKLPISISQFPNLSQEKFLCSIRRSIYMVAFLNLETTYEKKYINDYLIYVKWKYREDTKWQHRWKSVSNRRYYGELWDGYRGRSRKCWWWSWSRDWPKAGPASPDVIKNDNRLYDQRKYARQYTWFYYNLAKYEYLCKICEVFYSDHSCPTGQGRRAWSHNAV